MARVSEQFGSVSGGVVIKEEDDDEEDEEEEELAVNHSGMWNFREFGGNLGVWEDLAEFGSVSSEEDVDEEEEELAVNHSGM